MRRRLPALLLCAACTRDPAPAAAPPVDPPAPAANAARPGDAPLPAAEEVPAFLREAPPREVAPKLPVEVVLDDRGVEAFAAEPEREPTLAELMRHVRIEDGSGPADDGEAWAFIGGGAVEGDAVGGAEAIGADGRGPAAIGAGDGNASDAGEANASGEAAAAAADGNAAAADDGDAAAASDDADAATAADDPCAPLRRLLEKRKDYLRRVAAERDAFGYVESADDAAALRLLQGLRRCAEHPDDEDCRPRPLEVDLSELEAPPHRIHRSPSELDAEGKHPDEIPHDPVVLDLLHQLRACERETVAQPLLQP